MKVQAKQWVSAVVVAGLMLVAVTAYADDEAVDLPRIEDGRINAYDIAAPVAIYQHYAYPYADDTDMGVLETIEFWGLTSAETFNKVLEVSRSAITEATSSGGNPVLIVSNAGYSLYKEADGSLTLIAPSDHEGKVYQFNWLPSL